jgi:hypothetical protein
MNDTLRVWRLILGLLLTTLVVVLGAWYLFG